ncbi:MAG TPA: metallophosphoesterase [Fimbriimonadaceae bacterium]|nr:metallophosphoesterase [Armatimonadota bacterium]HCM73880.1 metallophosphoesterase [Armatimonadota bacterium]HRD31961.1 metallophosphoesterase [Fimbriimonadaceae bacterium]HRE92635.1 metallophosphoesterase [Fimbriimonadaceae bacterium]HRI73622.1 metallophosphoesterase [Fimbriimonadaceae bacterium]
MATKSTRRELLAAGGALGGSILASRVMGTWPGNQDAAPNRVLRIAHLTDIHVQPERKGGEGMAHAFEIVNDLKDKPDLILTGGDLIMDSFGADKARAKVQWDLFDSVIRNHNGLPVRHCLGNHDYWNGAGGGGKNDPMFGWNWAQDVLKLDAPYYAFRQAGWQFIVLQSTMPLEAGGYTAKLDDAQFEWLADTLEQTPREMPVLVLSHIPILSICATLAGDTEKTGNWVTPGSWMHIDARKIKDLFHKHPNVKVCLSGHEHLVDDVEYLDVTYVCNGAVSGGWWGGNFMEFGPGYALVDLYEDGTFRNEFIPSGWVPAAE